MQQSNYSAEFQPGRSRPNNIKCQTYREFVIRVFAVIGAAENYVLTHFVIFLSDCAIAHIKTAVPLINLGF